MSDEKPTCEIIGIYSDIIPILAFVVETLNEAGLEKEKKELIERIVVNEEAETFMQFIHIIEDYVNVE